jgi:hypothetical protein
VGLVVEADTVGDVRRGLAVEQPVAGEGDAATEDVRVRRDAVRPGEGAHQVGRGGGERVCGIGEGRVARDAGVEQGA